MNPSRDFDERTNSSRHFEPKPFGNRLKLFDSSLTTSGAGFRHGDRNEIEA
jgi:hypothetical protein